MSWEVVLSTTARENLRDIPASERKVVLRVLQQLSDDPNQVNLKKLQGSKILWRARAGKWRLIFSWDQVRRLVEVARIVDRKDAY